MGDNISADMETKVVIEQRVLHGDQGLQLIAVVYFGREEFRVYAPARAIGDPLEWIDQLLVHRSEGVDQYDVAGPYRRRLIEATIREFERSRAEAAQTEADALYCAAQICMNGDVQSSDGTPFDPAGHCTKCGAACIHHCGHCKARIRGKIKYSAADYELPSFCHGCGHPYPWMEDKLATARDLLFHDDQLTFADRTELWGLLQYVMSNPKANLAPAKSKLIAIKIQKAAQPIREFVIDLLAKYGAEMSK